SPVSRGMPRPPRTLPEPSFVTTSHPRTALGAAVVSRAHDGDDQPDDAPQPAGEDGEQQMQEVVGLHALRQHALLALRAIGALLLDGHLLDTLLATALHMVFRRPLRQAF